MIYITGDTHSDFTRFEEEIFPEQNDVPEGDTLYMIITGDFGGVWYPENFVKHYIDYSAAEERELDDLNSKNFYTLFCDGNHENHKRLANYPVKEFCGGLVHEIRPKVLHLMRGEVYNIDGNMFFVMGGASSHDIRDGIIEMTEGWEDKANRWDAEFKQYRIKDLTWWEEEMPSEEELQHGRDNLAKVGNKVDFVVSHCAPSSTAALLGHGLYKPDKLTDYLEEIRQTVDYKKWFHGHYHDNRNTTDKELCLYEQIIRIA